MPKRKGPSGSGTEFGKNHLSDVDISDERIEKLRKEVSYIWSSKVTLPISDLRGLLKRIPERGNSK